MTKFSCIVADPPWKYGDKLKKMKTAGLGVETHYPCMTIPQICGVPYCTLEVGGPNIESLIADDAHLWLWVTNPFLVNEPWYEVPKAWGFAPKQILTWIKGRLDLDWPRQFAGDPTPKLIQQIAQGHYLRNSTEHVILCTRGSLKPLVRNVPTAFIGSRTKHSKKPDEAFRIFERVTPGPRLELFAREPREGWTSWGNEL